MARSAAAMCAPYQPSAAPFMPSSRTAAPRRREKDEEAAAMVGETEEEDEVVLGSVENHPLYLKYQRGRVGGETASVAESLSKVGRETAQSADFMTELVGKG